jgi:hypothetical protein
MAMTSLCGGHVTAGNDSSHRPHGATFVLSLQRVPAPIHVTTVMADLTTPAKHHLTFRQHSNSFSPADT